VRVIKVKLRGWQRASAGNERVSSPAFSLNPLEFFRLGG